MKGQNINDWFIVVPVFLVTAAAFVMYVIPTILYARLIRSDLGAELITASLHFSEQVSRLPPVNWEWVELVGASSPTERNWDQVLARNMERQRDAIVAAIFAQPERDAWDTWIAAVQQDIQTRARCRSRTLGRMVRHIVTVSNNGGGMVHGIWVPSTRRDFLSAALSVYHRSALGGTAVRAVACLSSSRILEIASSTGHHDTYRSAHITTAISRIAGQTEARESYGW